MTEDTVEWYKDKVTDKRISDLYSYIKPFVETESIRVLDLGCGVGNYLQRFSEASVGIDASLPGLEICKKKELHAQFGDLNKPLEFGCEFDVAFCSHVLEHVDSPLSLLRRATEC